MLGIVIGELNKMDNLYFHGVYILVQKRQVIKINKCTPETNIKYLISTLIKNENNKFYMDNEKEKNKQKYMIK